MTRMLEHPLHPSWFSLAQRMKIRADRLFRRDWSISLSNGKIYFSCINQATKKRVSTFFYKEPATLEWINTMEADDVLLDIGANIGLYSLYAAVESSLLVYSFEPFPSNYAVLVQNVALNKLQNRVLPVCIVFHKATSLGALDSKK